MKVGKAILLFITFFAVSDSFAESCLKLLDSANYYSGYNNEKSRFYAENLLVSLDQGECVKELGLTALYNNLGLLFWQLGDQYKALHSFKKGVSEIPRSDSLSIKLKDISYNLASLYQELGKFDSARLYLASVDDIISTSFGKQSKENILHLFRKGVFYRETGKFKESIDALNEAETITNSIQVNDSVKITLLIEIGTTYRHFGELEEGELLLTEAIKLARNNEPELYLTAIDRLATLKIEQGEYSDSESYLLHNLDKKRQQYPDDSLMILETLNGLGILYYKLNDLGSANKYVSEALNSSRDNINLEPYMLNNLGTIYMKMGEVDRALEYFHQSEKGFKELYGSMHPDYASCLNNLAGAEKEKGNLSEALSLYTKVLDMDKVIYGEMHQRYAATLNNIALLYIQLGSHSLSGRLLQKAKEIRAEVLGVNHPSYVKTLNDLGLYYLIENDTLSALRVFDEALMSEIHHMRDVFPVLTDKQRQLYFKQSKYNVERFSSLAFSGKFLYSEWAEKALNHFINTKGILFYASDKMRKVVQSSNDPNIKNVYNLWREKKYKLAQSYLLSEEEREKLGISITELEEECTGLEKQLALKFKVFSEQDQASYYEWETISKALRPEVSAVDIISFRKYRVEVKDESIEQGFEEKSNYVAFIIKPDTVLERVSWPEETDFLKAYAVYTNSLKFNIADRSSYHVFWEEIDDHLTGSKRVYLASDGIYYKLNPGVFFIPSQNKYVADKYDIINITSTKDLTRDEQKSFIREAKIFGNPAFSTLGSGYQLDPLPGAEREANDISGILNVKRWESEMYNYLEATESRVKEINNPGVIHIATHGYFKEDPDLKDPLHSSGLFLSRGEGEENDGILSAYEAMNLILDETNLVVLAACETGLGTIKNGEGVFGLQRAFLVAGANNVLISLVKINDQSARRFMNLFYEELITAENPQIAFFDARRKFKLEDPNPYNWGAYILVSKN